MLAFVFQRLATRKPDLDAGIFAYAKAGFGDYVGFNSAWGFWASACAGNTSYWVLIMTTTSVLFPALGSGDTVLAVIASSIGVWLFYALILRGVKEAAVINRIATVAKVVPLLVFIVIAIIAFKGGLFADNFWGGGDQSFSSIFEQAKGTMLITVFVFLGIEGASVYSRFARKREDVGRATIIGFLSVLSVFALVNLVSYGILPQDELAAVDQPSVGSVLESIVGHWGSIFIRVGVILSVLGAYLAWTLMAAEILYIPATTDDMPRVPGADQQQGRPGSSADDGGGAGTASAHPHAVHLRVAGFHARPHRRTGADPLPAGRRVHAEIDGYPRNLRGREITGARRHDRRPGHAVHAVPGLRGRLRQAVAVVHPVRAGRIALCTCPP